MKSKLLAAAMVVGLSMVGLSHSANAMPVLDITGGAQATDSRSFTLGYSFTVNSAITIDGLGLWDEGSDGLSQGYAVRLWDAAQTILRTATVDNGSAVVASANAAGRWLFEDVVALNLAPGDYVVGFFRPGDSDPWRFRATPNTISEITFGSRLELQGGSLTFPTVVTGSSDGHFGPNLRTVPEPGTLAIFGLGLVGLGLARRRKAA